MMAVRGVDLARDYRPVHQRECYRTPGIAIDVAKAWRLIAALTPEERGERLERITLRRCQYAIDTHMLDAARAMQADLTVPLLVGTWVNRDRSRGSHIVDGYNRCFKAQKMGKKTLPAFRLTVEETEACAA